MVKSLPAKCRRHKRHGFDSWVRKIPWKRIWQPTQVFLPGESQEQRKLEGYSSWGHRVTESDTIEVTYCARIIDYIRLDCIFLFLCMMNNF